MDSLSQKPLASCPLLGVTEIRALLRADNDQCVFRMLRPLLFSHMGSSGLLIQFLRKGDHLFLCKGYAQEWTQNVGRTGRSFNVIKKIHFSYATSVLELLVIN